MKLLLKNFFERSLEDSLGHLLTFHFMDETDHTYTAKFIDMDLAISDINRWYNLACCFVTANKTNQDVWIDIPDQDPLSHVIAWSTLFMIELVARPNPFIPYAGRPFKEIQRKDHQ